MSIIVVLSEINFFDQTKKLTQLDKQLFSFVSIVFIVLLKLAFLAINALEI